MSFCPNLSNKQVKQEFDSIVDAVGNNMAYYLWNKYEGDYAQISQEIWVMDTNPEIEQTPVVEQPVLISQTLNSTEISNIFTDFMERVAFDVENKEGLIKPTIDVVNKLFQIGEVNDDVLTKAMAELGWALLDKYTQREIVKHYGKAKLLGGDITDNIIYDLQQSIEKGVATNFEKSWFDKIMKKLAEFIGRIVHNRMTYFAAIDNLAESIAKNHDGYFDTLIKEGFEQKNITLEDIHSTPIGKVYDILTSDKFGGTLGGSAAIRLQGTLYRAVEEDFHDLDFIMPYSKFSWNIHEAIGRFYDNKNKNQSVMGWVEASKQAKEQLLKEADVIFKRSDLFKEMSKNFDKVNLKNVFYTPKNGICFTFEVDGFPVDLFFSKDVKPIVINGIKVSHFSISFAAKVIMARPKDMRDIINFRKFSNLEQPSALDNLENRISTIPSDVREELITYPSDGDYTAKQFMQTMLESQVFFQDATQQEIALKLFDKLTPEFKIKFSNDNDYLMQCKGNEITITTNALNNADTYTFGHAFLHETMHPIVRKEAGKGGYLYDTIENIIKNVKSQLTEEELKDPLFYGLTNSKEFASEIFTNPFFRNELIKRYDPKGWRKLLQKILSFFGLKKLSNRVALNSEYVYNEISKLVDNYTGNPKYDRLVGDTVEKYAPGVLNQLQKDAQKQATKIKTGLSTRLKALKGAQNQNPVRIAELQNQILQYEDMLFRGELQECFVDFIQTTNPLYNNILNRMRKAVNDISTISNDDLLQIKNDFIDFYGPVIKEFKDNLFVNGYFDNLDPVKKGVIARNLNLIDQAHTEIKAKWGIVVKDKAAEIIKTYAEAQGRSSEEIDNYLNDAFNQTDADINFYSRFIQSAARVTDVTISTMHRLLSDCNQESIRFANGVFQDLKATAELVNMSRKDILDLFEKDSRGRTTGNLIRDLNYGEFNNDYKKFINDLNKQYGVLDGEQYSLPDDKFIEYNREKEDWLCNHCERKFKSFYYRAYAELSSTTRQVLNNVNDEIKRITDSVASPTGAKLENLSDSDYKRLNGLYTYKRNLANRWDEDGNLKFGDDLKVAEELNNFNKVIASGGMGTTYTQQEIIDLIDHKKRYLSPSDFKKWYDRNISIVYSQSFTNDLSNVLRYNYGQKYKDLQDEKNSLLRYGKSTTTPYVDAEKLSQPVKDRIKLIDVEQALIRQQVKASGNATMSGNLTFDQIAQTEFTLRYYQDKANAQSRGLAYYQQWYDANHIGDQPVSYYTKLKPLTSAGLEYRLNPMNQELSADSPLMNPNFDFSSTETKQPKRNLYDNHKAFYKAIFGRKKAFYDTIVKIMSEANQKLPWLDSQSSYTLPQKTGDMVDYLFRSKRNVFKAIWDYNGDAITIRPDDPGYALDNFSAKPGGGQIDFIPTYYVKKLDNPEYISRNLIGLVAEYARMAENYRVKKEHQGDFMVIDEALAGRDVIGKDGTAINNAGKEIKSYKKYHEMLNMHLYGRMHKELIIDLGFFKFKIPAKLWHGFISYSTKLGLGHNRNSIIKSFFQAQLRAITEAVGHRYFDTTDLIKAIGQQIFYLPKWFYQLGNPNANDFSIALMQHLNIAREFNQNLEGLQYNRIFRLISKYGIMGGWSFIDYFAKTPIVKAIAANFRLDPTSGKFMPKHKFINTYYADDRKKGAKEFNKLKTRWLDVVTSINGKIVPKKGFEHLADAINDKDTVNLLRNVSEFITNRIDGKISEEDKTQWMTSMLGAAACMHRWYYLFNLDDNFASRYQYNPMIEDTYEARFQSVAKVIWKGSQNIFIGLQNLFGSNKEYKEIKSISMYNFRKSLAHLAVISSSAILLYGLVYPLIFGMSGYDDDDDDDYSSDDFSFDFGEDAEGLSHSPSWSWKGTAKRILLGLAVAQEGAIQEEYSEYPTVSFKNGILNPQIPLLTQLEGSSMWSTLTPMASSAKDLFNAAIYQNIANLRYNFGNIYDSGAYAGLPYGARNIIRATPGLRNIMDFNNVYDTHKSVSKHRPYVFKKLHGLFQGNNEDDSFDDFDFDFDTSDFDFE